MNIGKSNGNKIGYVVKRYPRYSETFIVNEIIAHEAAGLDIGIFSLRPTVDTRFQDIISKVRAPVVYLPFAGVRTADFWASVNETAKLLPDIWSDLRLCEGEDHHNVNQALHLARHIVKTGIRHLHAHFASSATSVARLAASFAGISYSFTAHAKDIFHESVDEADLARKIRDARNVVTISDFNLNFLTDRFRPKKRNCVRVYNGIDLKRFSFQTRKNDSRRIVAVGRLVEKKGFRYLIQAGKILADRGVDFSCRIIGEGEFADELQVLISRYGIEKQVELTGPKPQNEIIKELQDSRVFAAPCVIGTDGNMDGLPTVIIEAMALGVPCIATDVTAIPEIVRHGETGLIVERENPESLADAIELLLKDENTGRELAKNGRRLVEESFNVDLNALEVRRLFIAKKVSEIKKEEALK